MIKSTALDALEARAEEMIQLLQELAAENAKLRSQLETALNNQSERSEAIAGMAGQIRGLQRAKEERDRLLRDRKRIAARVDTALGRMEKAGL